MNASYRTTIWHRWAITLSLVLGLGFVLTPMPVHAATATTDTIIVKAGSQLTVRGQGFKKHEDIASWATSVRGNVYATARGHTDSTGVVVLQISVKRFWERGWWAVTLRSASKRQAIATFQVEAAPPDGRLDVDPPTVNAGARISFRGTGLQLDEAVHVWATLPDGTAVTFFPYVGRSGGDIYFAYDVPDDGAPGTWWMTAYGTQSDRILVVSFTVLR